MHAEKFSRKSPLLLKIPNLLQILKEREAAKCSGEEVSGPSVTFATSFTEPAFCEGRKSILRIRFIFAFFKFLCEFFLKVLKFSNFCSFSEPIHESSIPENLELTVPRKKVKLDKEHHVSSFHEVRSNFLMF